MASVLITNAKLVNEGQIHDSDLLVIDGRIEKIAKDLQSAMADQVIDARGSFLLPGMIDDQVHFREPGLMHKGDFATESAAAVAGGITSTMEMPNSNPQTIDLDALADKYARAAGRSWTNFGFYFGATKNNLEAIKQIDQVSCAGLKIFMGASTGNMLVNDPQVLANIFTECPRLIVTHCEDTPMILVNEAQYQQKYGDDIPIRFHPLIRSREACIKSSEFAKNLALETKARLHVLHLTTAEEANAMSRLSDAFVNPDQDRITAEVCVHHLFFSEADYESLGSLIKCNPSIKATTDRSALRQAVLDDRIACIATDHAPHTLAEKQNPYIKAPSGLPLVQHALPALLELVHEGVFDLPLVVRKTSHAVANLYKIPDRGYLREGYWADLVLVKPVMQPVADQKCFYKCDWTPFQKQTFNHRITHTLVNGQVVYQDQGQGQQHLGNPVGQALSIGALR